MNSSVSILTIVATVTVCAPACERRPERERPAFSGQAHESMETAFTQTATGPTPRNRPNTMETNNSKGYVQNIEALTESNSDFRRVLYTSQHTQLVLMSLPPGEHIGAEVHDVDQFFRIEQGSGEFIINQTRRPLEPGSAIVVPAGAKHDVINTGDSPLKLYTLYSPPHHRDGVVHPTRADAEKDKEHFDGETTEP